VLRLVRVEPGEEAVVNVGPTREAIVSWNGLALDGAIELRANAIDGRTSPWLPYVAFSSEKRASLASRDGFLHIDTDVLRGETDFVAIGIRSRGALDAVFVSTPDYGAPSSIVALPAVDLAVPPYSQFEPAYPGERGWCAPASLAMLLAYRDYPVDVPIVAREVFDARYGGTGNWTFNTAFAGRLGFPAAVMHLRDLGHAHAFVVDDIPLALSIAWGGRRDSGRPARAVRRSPRRVARHRSERRRARQRPRATGRRRGLSARRLRARVARARRHRVRGRAGALRGSALASCRNVTGRRPRNPRTASARTTARTHRCTSFSSSRRFRPTPATSRVCARRPDARCI
jgi:hypothetical protein